MTGMSSPGELVLGEELAHLHLDELQELGVVDHVRLVQGDDDRRHLDLAGEEDVLTRLRHRAVCRRYDEDRAVHLRGARDHVLDVVGVARAVDVGVVPVLGLVLDMRGVDRDAPLALLGSLVDRIERRHCGVRAGLGEHLGDRGCERRLAVVDVTDRSDVDVRLGALELLLAHGLLPPGTRLTWVFTLACRSTRAPRRSCAVLPRSGRTASKTSRGPATSSAGRSRSRTSPRAGRSL